MSAQAHCSWMEREDPGEMPVMGVRVDGLKCGKWDLRSLCVKWGRELAQRLLDACAELRSDGGCAAVLFAAASFG